jgi:2-polyprenyl-3-methyl-5-hydroxy-6-metoxy-1,4-benzoquinol methylase
MIESNNPEINIDELMEKIREEVTKRKADFSPANATINPSTNSPTNINLSYIESLLSNAESRACQRTKLPDKFNSFPFNISDKIKEFLLKVFNLLFRDQREVNFNLIESLRQSVALNQKLIEEITTLKTQMDERLRTVNINVQEMDDHFHTIDNWINTYMTSIQKNLDAVNNQVQGIDQHLEAVGKLDNEEQHALDAFYVAFEDKFRGSREDIHNRLKVYLPLIEEAKIGTPDAPILDVGCGRGEWLELLRESGYTAKGIDINRVMQEQCQARGLEVLESDVIAYLQSLPDGSLGAVTGFHIIEHLEFPVLIKLLEEVVRVLKPEGIAIFETPNPKNLVVGACNFYSDLTHRNPVFPETIQFCLSFKGLSNVQLLYLNPVDNSPFDKQDIETLTLNTWFFGPRDYAVIGYKK